MSCFVMFSLSLIFFFKQKTAYDMRISDWSSDVGSSDLWALEIEGEVAAGATIEDRAVYPDEVFHFRVLDVREPDSHPGEVLGIVGEGQILLARRQAVDLIGAAQATQQEGDGVAEADAILFQSEEIIALDRKSVVK